MSLKSLGSSGYQMKRVASTAMLNSTKTECKKRLVEILLSNNLNLLVIICQSPLLNESHSNLPKSILKLLMAYRENLIETFIIRLLSYKAKMYRIKNRDSCDILRDNSFLSTLLNTYAHEIGYRYLTTTLSSTIKEALVYSKDLELDPNRIKKKLIAEQTPDNQQQLLSPQVNETVSMTMSTFSETLSGIIDDGVETENDEEINLKVKQIVNNNIAKIENICLSFLNCIISNKEKMPNTLHHLCFSIANVVEYSYNQEYDGNDLVDYDYVSRQNSDLSVFNILNYKNNDDNSTSSIPFPAKLPSVGNFVYDDKGSSSTIDTQNIYNQYIYNSNDRNPMQSNTSINTNNGSTISASPSRNSFNHKKYETYTAGITYNVGFNNLKQAPSNISTSSNIMGNDYKYIDSMNNSKSASIERLDIDTKCLEVKPDDTNIIHSAPIIERRNSRDRDKLIKQQRRYNVFNNDFYSKNFKLQNINQYLNSNSNTNSNSNQDQNQNRLSFNKRILSASDEDIMCSSPTSNSLNIDDDERSYRSHSNHTSLRISDEELLTLSEMLKLDMNREESVINYERLKDRNGYTIEEEEEEMMKEDKNNKRNSSNSGKSSSNSHNENKETNNDANEGMEIKKNKDETKVDQNKDELDEIDMTSNRLEILNIINSLDSNKDNVLNHSGSDIAETKDNKSEESKNDKVDDKSDAVSETSKDNINNIEVHKSFPLKRESISFNFDSRKSSRTDYEKSNSFLHSPKKENPKLSETNEDEEVEEERYFVSLNDVDDKDSKSDRRKKMEKQGSRFFEKTIEYTNSEKVVGTFLFLIFFVPAITSPESIGLTSKKISTSDRKSLIVCGKVLTSLCNNVNFGGKEKYMEYLNPFLQVHREETRDFLQWAISYKDDQLPIINVNINDNGLTSPKITTPINDLDTMVFNKKYGSEYSSENSSYASLIIPEPNSPSGRYIFDNKNKNKNDGYISPGINKANPCRLGSFSEEGSCFNSLPILTADSNSSIDKLSVREKNLLGSKGSMNSNKPNHKNGLSQFVPLKDAEPSNSVRNINTTDLKKDYDAEIKEIVSFLSKNIHLLEKEIDEKTQSIPEEELEGVYSGFIELKQLIFLSEDNNTMKTWFKKIFKSKYGSTSMDNLILQKPNKSRRSSNNNILK